ncbi:Gp138 family membrane-puncturing spike protein [Apilactobacillus quenuiae]|uniref:Gp138 family membrane-puncturing spike protein n=1 Tax=Apilactobacillus quenuiae TaxID=2008377 RepID=UPI000D020BF2|nr:Gp138 family membrane-puncturing spike protein [Apilactobacillus quenuiae]
MLSQNKVAQQLKTLLNQQTKNINFGINVGEFAEVNSFDNSKKLADVTPLIDDKGGIDESVKINQCPVLNNALMKLNNKNCYVYDPLKKGEVVFIVFSNRNLDDFHGGKYTKDSERMHSINDAVIIGRFN